MRSSVILGLVVLLIMTANGEDIVFPVDSGVLNARDFGAKGDGVTDDTAAIQRALAQGLDRHTIVYLPDGTYRVSDTLAWRNAERQAKGDNGGWGRFLSLQGQSRTKTIIKLVDRAAGFTDATQPKPVVMTASGDDTHTYNDANGEGNQAFENHLWNLTIDVGIGNPGAVGIDYQVSNWGALRQVTVTAPEGSGHTGISLLRRDNGPGLIQRVSVRGFRRGLAADGEVCHLMAEYLDLSGQGEVGVENAHGIFTLRAVTSNNRVPVIRNRGFGLVVLLDPVLRGGMPDGFALENVDRESRLVVQGLTCSGYGHLARNRAELVDEVKSTAWISDGRIDQAKIPFLTVRDTPESPTPPLSQWVGAGPANGQDDTAGIQAALNAGKPVVYLRAGRYVVNKTLTVPATVKRIVGMGVNLGARGEELKNAPLFRFTGGGANDSTVIERLEIFAPWTLAHDSSRTLVVRDLRMDGYRAGANAGRLFVENVSGGPWHLVQGQQVWARQWNTECPPPCIVNRGARIWCLGFKTETGETMIENRDGGVAAFWGGFVYTFGGIPRERPGFLNVDSTLLMSFAGTSYVADGGFTTWIRDQRGATITDLTRDQVSSRGISSVVPLWVGAPDKK